MSMQTVLDSDMIRMLLPHRYPFLLLDKVIKIVPGVEAIGVKNVTVNEPFFQGHFPQKSIMPGVMIVEALAQLTAIAYCSRVLKEKGVENFNKLQEYDIRPEEIAGHVGYLVDINVKFKRVVVPGDQLILNCLLGRSMGVLSQVKVSALIDKAVVAEGRLTVSEGR